MSLSDLYGRFRLGDEVYVEYGEKTYVGVIAGVFEPEKLISGSSGYIYAVHVGKKVGVNAPYTECLVASPKMYELIKRKEVVIKASSEKNPNGLRLKYRRFTFPELIEHESAHPGLFYKRTDYDAQWCITFDPNKAGLLRQWNCVTKKEGILELYHHDFMDGLFDVYTTAKCSRRV